MIEVIQTVLSDQNRIKLQINHRSNMQIQKIIWNCKDVELMKTILENNKGGELTLPYFKNYYEPTVSNPNRVVLA